MYHTSTTRNRVNLPSATPKTDSLVWGQLRAFLFALLPFFQTILREVEFCSTLRKVVCHVEVFKCTSWPSFATTR
jgi:hypothetical protein